MITKKKKTRWTRNFYAFGPKRTVAPPSPPDYLSLGGKGDRRRDIYITSGGSWQGSPFVYINGSLTDTSNWINGGNTSDFYLIFDLHDAHIITEAIWYQSGVTSQGNWKWQGSNNATDWTDIGGIFALGTSTAQTITTLNSNTNSYRYYRLQGVSGTTSSGPFIQEIEFKIGGRTTNVNGTLYTNPYGIGLRTTPVITSNASIGFGNLSQLTNNSWTNEFFPNIQAAAGKEFKFDFLTPHLIDESTWWFGDNTAMGVWKWQGSTDNSNWTDIGPSFTLGATINAGSWMQSQQELKSNSAYYRYYRIFGISGNITNTYILEVEFRLIAQ